MGATLATRRGVEHGSVAFVDLYLDHGLCLPAGEIAYVSRWITPAASPRRYDTRFLAAAMPARQTPQPDRWEATEVAWWAPAAALDAWRANEIDLIEPTVANLAILERFVHGDRPR